MTHRRLANLILCNFAVAVAATILIQVFRQDVTIHDIGNHLQFSLVYTFCIGTPAWLTMGRVAPRLFCLPRFWRMPSLIGVLAGFALAGSLTANLIFVALGWQTLAGFWPEFRYGLRIAMLLTVVLGVTMTAFEVLRDRLQAATGEIRRRQLEEERARQLATQARLASLESRIHPHFLFNTLNSISALIREDPRKAERTVEQLAALLRYSLDHHARGLVPLGQELQVVEDYLDIEKTRFGDRLRFTLDVPPDLAALEVPPLALQCLVENSIKHAVALNRHGGEITVAARLQPEGLFLEVSDDGPGFELTALQQGHGLETLQERLTALTGAQGRLEIARRGGRMVVGVLVPQKAVAA